MTHTPTDPTSMLNVVGNALSAYVEDAVAERVTDATAALTADLAAMTAQRDAAIVERDAVQAAFDDHMATAHPPTPVPSSRFPGDPGVGRLFYGNNGEGHHTRAEMDATVYGSTNDRVSLIRVYNSGNQALGTGLRNALVQYANEGRIPLLSTKSGGFTAAQLAAGAGDAVWRDTARFLADVYPATAPLHYSPFWHEPEDNHPAGSTNGNSAADYRRAFRRAVQIHLDERPVLRDRVTWCGPWLMEFTYDTNSRDYRNWHPCWDGTKWLTDGPFNPVCSDGSVWSGSWIHLDAIDLYNPVVGGFTANHRNQTWTQSTAAFRNKRSAANQPPLCFSIGEYGFKSVPDTLDDNGVTLEQLVHETVDVGAARDGLVDACVWTNDSYEPLPGNDPSGLKRAALRTLGARSEVVRAGQVRI